MLVEGNGAVGVGAAVDVSAAAAVVAAAEEVEVLGADGGFATGGEGVGLLSGVSGVWSG